MERVWPIPLHTKGTHSIESQIIASHGPVAHPYVMVIMNIKVVIFKVLLFAFYLSLKWVNRAHFCNYIASESRKSSWKLIYFFWDRIERWAFIYSVCSTAKLNWSFLMMRIYSCNTILLWWRLGVNATVNVRRKRSLLLPKALEINLE